MTNNDKQLIVECLLFSASVQVCANWNEEKQARMIELAKTLGVNPSEDIEFWKDELESEEPWSDQIPKYFKIKQTGLEPEEPKGRIIKEGEDKESKDE